MAMLGLDQTKSNQLVCPRLYCALTCDCCILSAVVPDFRVRWRVRERQTHLGGLSRTLMAWNSR